MILPDSPIELEEADRLGRKPLAAKVAEVIKKYEGKESIVVGIEGPWGSGKTSFINLVLKHLEGSEKHILVPFNPWNFTGQNELIGDFFSSLLSGMKSKVRKGLIKRLNSYRKKLQTSFSPTVSFLGAEFSLGSIGGKDKVDTLQDERKEIDNALRSIPQKLIVVIDDTDRLDKTETRLVMKLVKMTANFPNTIFLLAYDRERVAKRLEEDGWPGEEYLKKIIQVSFTLPPPDREGLSNILFTDLDKTIEAVYGNVQLEGETEKRWQELLSQGFTDLFKTVRDIKRFISSLGLNWSIMGETEINMIDFIAIEAVRVFAPGLYAAISSHKSLFTESGRSMGGRMDESKAKESRYEELLALAPADLRRTMDKICRFLFPHLSGHAHDNQRDWRVNKRICAVERFNFYFQLGIPSGAVSEKEITDALHSASSKDAFEATLSRFVADKRARAFLGKLLDYVGRLDEAKTKNLLLALWKLGKSIKHERSAMFDFDDAKIQIMRLGFNSIQQVIPVASRFEFLKDLIQNTEALYWPTHLISVAEQQLEKQDYDAKETLLTPNDLQKLKPILLEKIEKLIGDRTLIADEDAIFFLYRLKEWGKEAEAKKYVGELIESRAGLLQCLKAFVTKVYSTAGDYFTLDKKSLGNFAAEDILEKKVSEISESEYASLSQEEKQAVDLFRNPKGRW